MAVAKKPGVQTRPGRPKKAEEVKKPDPNQQIWAELNRIKTELEGTQVVGREHDALIRDLSQDLTRHKNELSSAQNYDRASIARQANAISTHTSEIQSLTKSVKGMEESVLNYNQFFKKEIASTNVAIQELGQELAGWMEEQELAGWMDEVRSEGSRADELEETLLRLEGTIKSLIKAFSTTRNAKGRRREHLNWVEAFSTHE